MIYFIGFLPFIILFVSLLFAANTVLLPKSAGAKNSDQHTNSGSQTEKAMTFGSAAIGVGEDSGRPGEPVFRTENRVGNRTSVPPETVKLNLQTQASSLDDRVRKCLFAPEIFILKYQCLCCP